MFRQSNDVIFVDTYALEVYLPYEYMGKAYRGYEYYNLVGTHVQFYAVGMMRAFKDQKALDNPESIPCYPLGIPMKIESAPSDIDVREVRFKKNGVIRKCIVLTYFKDDQFMTNNKAIKSPNNVMILLDLMDGGKLSFMPPDVVAQIMPDSEDYNGVKLRIPSEEEEIFVAEKYRNPANHYKVSRVSSNVDPDILVSYNTRQDNMQKSTYQAWTGEDISTSLIVSANRHEAGIVDEPTIMERIVRNMDMEPIIDDRNKRYENIEKQIQNNINKQGQ